MNDDELIGPPVQREDLEALRGFSIEPGALGEFEWFGFTTRTSDSVVGSRTD